MKPAFHLFPEAASTVAGEVDGLTLGLVALCGLMAALIVVLIVFFGARYRAGSPHSRKTGFKSENRIEWAWTLSTLGVFLGMFAWGSVAYLKMHLAPPGAYEVTVVGKQWMWKFQHPDGHRELDTLHVPVHRPILLTMTSEDVIHSLFVPAFRIKQDVVPGRYTYTWFEATKPGSYHLFCTQYCGTMHAEMGGEVVAMPEPEFSQWLQTGLVAAAQANASTRAARGQELFKKMACVSCHGSGSTFHAPDLAALYGSQVQLSNDRAVTADDNYLRESILNPRAKIVRGFEPIMPSFAGLLDEDQVLDLIGYIKSLKTASRAELPSPREVSR